jgi:hypothetical protein
VYIGEEVKDFESLLRVLTYRLQTQIWTALPGTVNLWNYPSTGQNTVVAVPGIMQQVLQDDGTWLAEPMPPHNDVPVHYLGGGGFHFTHPIAQGDEGILLYQARCIDSWWQNGGIQPRPDYGQSRMHDLSDAIFIPTRLSNKNILTDIDQTAAQLRSTDGTSNLTMLPDGGGFRFVTPGGATIIDGSGNFTTTGEITRGQGGADQVTLGQHKHPTAPTGAPSSPTPGT